MSALGLMLLLVSTQAPADGGVDAPKKPVVDVVGALANMRGGNNHGGITQCASCHATNSWTDVRFNHDRTGFPLTGKHARTSCKSCHVVDFTTPLTRGCVGCHRDAHAGDLGARCESCHDTTDWRSRFDADAHRRTNFPLLGGHAALPCVECHFESRERRFSRRTVDCADCHQSALLRTVGTDKILDHTRPDMMELTRNCGQCHGPTSFTPARFAPHEKCFPILAGPHAGVKCDQCHLITLPMMPSFGLCKSGNAAGCVGCHQNDGRPGKTGITNELHRDVQLYDYAQPRKCAECHKGQGGL
ncbi:MAG: cytochrome c3 family protein [Myxococcaceae bacterium]